MLLRELGSANVFVANNFIEKKHCIVAKTLDLLRLTSRSYLFSPFPFRPADHSSTNAFHHKTRRTSSCTRSGFHRSLTTILSRNLSGNQETHTILYHDNTENYYFDRVKTRVANIACWKYNLHVIEE